MSLRNKDKRIKNRINSIRTKEEMVQRICTLYYSMGKDKKRRQEILYIIRKHQRAYMERFGNDFEGFPIEVMNNLFLNWDG